MSGKISNFFRALRMGRKYMYLKGTDLQGNKYFEYPGVAHPRTKRVVEQATENPLPISGKDMPAQWQAWLRHTRAEPPTIEELEKDERRQIITKENARKLEEYWDSRRPAALLNSAELGPEDKEQAEILRRRKEMYKSPLEAFDLSNTESDNELQPWERLQVQDQNATKSTKQIPQTFQHEENTSQVNNQSQKQSTHGVKGNKESFKQKSPNEGARPDQVEIEEDIKSEEIKKEARLREERKGLYKPSYEKQSGGDNYQPQPWTPRSRR